MLYSLLFFMGLQVKNFDDLTLRELYEILKLRFNVFIVEQNSIYDEYDDVDYKAIHVFQMSRKKCVAYARVYMKSRTKASLGRIVLSKSMRRGGVGKKLVQHAIDVIKSNFSAAEVEIGAQEYLVDFYKSFGFEVCSDAYDDGGVPHVDMVLDLG